MYEELISTLRNNADHYAFTGDNGLVHLLTNAADAIEELQRRLEQALYMPLPRWIPVTERLPRMWEEVMLQFPNNQAVGFNDGDSGWAVFSGDNFYTYVAPEEVHPTHWMPLPELPKEESNGV